MHYLRLPVSAVLEDRFGIAVHEFKHGRLDKLRKLLEDMRPFLQRKENNTMSDFPPDIDNTTNESRPALNFFVKVSQNESHPLHAAVDLPFEPNRITFNNLQWNLSLSQDYCTFSKLDDEMSVDLKSRFNNVCKLEFPHKAAEVKETDNIQKQEMLQILRCAFKVHQYIWLSDNGGKSVSPHEATVLNDLFSAALDDVVSRFNDATQPVKVCFKLACTFPPFPFCLFN